MLLDGTRDRVVGKKKRPTSTKTLNHCEGQFVCRHALAGPGCRLTCCAGAAAVVKQKWMNGIKIYYEPDSGLYALSDQKCEVVVGAKDTTTVLGVFRPTFLPFANLHKETACRPCFRNTAKDIES